MSKFRVLIEDTVNKKNKKILNTEFLLANDIDPMIVNRRLPLWDEKRKCLVILGTPSKNNSFFTRNDPNLDVSKKQTFDTDTITYIIQQENYVPYTEKDKDRNGGYYEKNFIRYKPGTTLPLEMTIKEVKDIINDPRNEETIADKGYTPNYNINVDPSEKDRLINDFATKELQAKTEKEQAALKWLDIYKDDLDITDFVDKLAPSKKLVVALKLKSKIDNGYDLDDLEFEVWKLQNEKVLNILYEKIKEVKDKDRKQFLLKAFDDAEYEWYTENLTAKSLLLAAIKWQHEIDSVKEESITEAKFNMYKEKDTPIYNEYELRHMLYNSPIDPKFLTVPFVDRVYYKGSDNQTKERTAYYTIKGFSNDKDLSKILLKTYPEGKRVEMDTSKVIEIVNREENKNASLDTDQHRLYKDKQFSSLNNDWGKYVQLDDTTIRTMLKIVQEEDPRTFPNIIKKYENETVENPNPLVLKALQAYNGSNKRNFVIKRNKNGTYSGYVVYEPTSKATRGIATTNSSYVKHMK